MAKRLIDDAEAIESEQLCKLRTQLANEKTLRTEAGKQQARLQKILDHQSELLTRKASQLFKSPKSRPKASCEHFHRVFIPDTHGAHIDQRAAAAFLGDLEYLQPREIVWGGDHLDCGGFCAQHHVIGFIAEMGYSYADDIDAGNQFVDQVQQRAPQAVHHWLTGNHEHRIQKWCVQQSIGRPRDAEMHMRNYSVDNVLHLAKRGINYYPRGYIDPNLRTRGAIKLGCCHFVHDISTARNAAKEAIGKWGANVCFGDTHRFDMAISRKADRDIMAVTNGCLSTLRPYWQETNITDWSHGYGVQIVTSDGEFLHVFIPILNGKSLLGPMLGRVK